MFDLRTDEQISQHRGDGATTAGSVIEADGAGTVAGSHVYPNSGVYTVTLTVSNNDGDWDQSTYQYIVIFNPDGGFVTGGGWITSPTGACQLTPVCAQAEGKTTFGFNSKYTGNAYIPTGNIEFQFQAGNVNFHSVSYQWLVVSEDGWAQFKGTGTINGGGNYGFLLTVVDAKLSSDTSADLFRMKIWDKNTGEVVYDNLMGAPDDAVPTVAIEHGSIVVHKAK